MSGAPDAAIAKPFAAGDHDLSHSAYQLTLAGMVFPTLAQWIFNLLAGLSLGLEGAPLLGAIWALGSCVSDSALQSVYRGWLPRAGEVESNAGLRRLAVLVGLRSLLWMSAPLAFTLATHSIAGVVQTAITALGLAALAVAAGWTSRAVFAAMAAPGAIALGVVAAALLPPAPAAGLFLGLLSFAAIMAIITLGSHKAVGEWSTAHAKMRDAAAEMKEALRRSEAAERRLKIAVGIADL
ncbi:MAG TPA: hypothetical protein VFE03_04635, partial [Caulobacteraceae bacterium]|nr:hypothetical protein [Caulobacteraceae bacterium]